MAKFCSNCGQPLEEGARFCGQCGHAVAQTSVNAGSDAKQPPVQQKGINNRVIGVAAVVVAVIIVILLARVFGGTGGNNSIVGNWLREDGSEILIFEDDGSCTVPFTYDGAWLESCDTYSIDDDGTLYLVSSRGNVSSEKYLKMKSVEEVEENGGYYLSGDTLVIRDGKRTYTYMRQ